MDSNFPKAFLHRIGTAEEYKYIPLDTNEVTIGRAKESTHNIADLLISRKHAVFKIKKDQWTVESMGMNGIAVNHVTLPRNQPIPLNHLDVIELGAGSKFVYTFRLLTLDAYEPVPKKMRYPLVASNYPNRKDSPAAFDSWVESKRNLQTTLVEEKNDIDNKLQEKNSFTDKLVLEKQKVDEYLQNVTKQLESQFAEEKRKLEEKVAHGELEKVELQKGKDILEQQMSSSLKELEAECLRKTLELEENVARANAEKQSLLEQKEMVVQQLQRENEILEGRLAEERRFSAATVCELTELKQFRESLERQLQEERRKFEEEKNQLLQQGTEAECRLKQLEAERAERERLLDQTKAELEVKEKEVAEIQSRAAIGLDVYQAIQELHGDHNEGNIVMIVEDIARQSSTSSAPPSEATNSVELELEQMREKLRLTVAEKEKVEEQLKNASMQARMDFVDKMEDVVENELQCGICSELLVAAVSLNCMHTFCQFCIGQWKKNKVECPVCRCAIVTEGRSLVIDSAIDGIVSTLSEDMQRRRRELVQQRKQIAEQALAAQKQAAAQKAAQPPSRARQTNRRAAQSAPAPRQQPVVRPAMIVLDHPRPPTTSTVQTTGRPTPRLIAPARTMAPGTRTVPTPSVSGYVQVATSHGATQPRSSGVVQAQALVAQRHLAAAVQGSAFHGVTQPRPAGLVQVPAMHGATQQRPSVPVPMLVPSSSQYGSQISADDEPITLSSGSDSSDDDDEYIGEHRPGNTSVMYLS